MTQHNKLLTLLQKLEGVFWINWHLVKYPVDLKLK